MTNGTTRAERDAEALEKGVFTGEEGGDPSSPESDLIAAAGLAVLGALAIVLALGLEVPNSIWTAPGLLPVITGATLLVMAGGLALKARRRGAQLRFDKRRRWLVGFLTDEENRRGGLLIVIIGLYVLAVDWLGFDWREDVGGLVLRFSSYELFSMIALTIVLRLFWQATWLKCAAVGVVWSLVLAAVFRYGFTILLPGSG